MYPDRIKFLTDFLLKSIKILQTPNFSIVVYIIHSYICIFKCIYIHTLTNTFFAVRVEPATAADYRVFKDYRDMEMPILLTMRAKKDKCALRIWGAQSHIWDRHSETLTYSQTFQFSLKENRKKLSVLKQEFQCQWICCFPHVTTWNPKSTSMRRFMTSH